MIAAFQVCSLGGIFLIQNNAVANFDEFEKPKSIRPPEKKRIYSFREGELVASVVLINYNHGHYLEEALNSIVNQTYPNVEIIVIDGGSVDNSTAILKSYPGVRWISEADNNGGHAFSKGVQLATGGFVYFLTSSDGFVDNRWIETSLEHFRENSDLALVSADVVGVRQNSVLNGYKWPRGNSEAWGNKELFFNWLFTGIGFTSVSFAIRREVLEICAPSIDLVLNYKASNSVNYFWHLIGIFFSSGFIGIKLPMVSTFVRFHGDRIDDAEYLPRQQNLLHRLIVTQRRKLIFSMKAANFISPMGEIVESKRIPHVEIVLRFALAKFQNLIARFRKNPLYTD